MADPRTRRIKYVCSACGSDDVLCDAYAEWDVEEQQWSLQNTFAKGAWCSACDGETRLKKVELTDDEYRAAASDQP